MGPGPRSSQAAPSYWWSSPRGVSPGRVSTRTSPPKPVARTATTGAKTGAIDGTVAKADQASRAPANLVSARVRIDSILHEANTPRAVLAELLCGDRAGRCGPAPRR